MAYHNLDETTPSSAATDWQADVDTTRDNLQILNDGVVLGDMPGWDMTITYGGSDRPSVIVYAQRAAAPQKDHHLRNHRQRSRQPGDHRPAVLRRWRVKLGNARHKNNNLERLGKSDRAHMELNNER